MQNLNNQSLTRVASHHIPRLSQLPEYCGSADVVVRQEILPLTSSRLHSVEAVAISHPGFVRAKNEDCFFLKTRPISQAEGNDQVQGVFVLCDGMGGYEQGEVASSIATFKMAQDLLEHRPPEFTAEISLKSSIYKVNQDIYQENLRLRQLGLGAMGTTAVAAVLQEQEIGIIHIGDSRCYRLTASKGLEQLTIDHERGQVQIAQGVSPSQAYAAPESYYLTQALGPTPNHLISPDVTKLKIEEDSLFLLCSDGLSDNQVVESCWQTYLMPYLGSQQPMNQAVEHLLDFGLQKNGHDNITILLIRICVK